MRSKRLSKPCPTVQREKNLRTWYVSSQSRWMQVSKWLKMYYCAYIGNFGEYACNPRTLSSSHLNHMVSLEGIVTKCSLVRPKVIKSFHYNETKNTFLERTYQDQTMTASGAASTSIYPTQDDEGNPVCNHAYTRRGSLLTYAADHRVWLLHLPRPPDDLYPGDA